MERALQVAVVTETYSPDLNGVARTLAEIVEGLRARGHGLQLIRPRPNDQPIPCLRSGLEELLLPALPVPTYPGQTMGWPALGTLHREWSHRRPDVVHIATEGPLGWAALQVGRQLGIPVSTDFRTNFHAYCEHYGLGWLRRPILDYLRHFHNSAQRTMVPTHSLRLELEAAGFTNLRVIARGVDTARFTPDHRHPELRRSWGAGDDTLVLLYVGRLAAEKNLETLFAAYRAIRHHQPDVKLVLVGQGPLGESLRERHGEAIFAGPLTGTDLAAHYASADLFLFPSRTETYGNVTAEAMASGLAVVAFARGAASRLVRSGVNGALVQGVDDEAFVAAALALARHRERLVRLGQASRRRALPLQWKRVVSRFERELRSLSRSQRSPGGPPPANSVDVTPKPDGILGVPGLRLVKPSAAGPMGIRVSQVSKSFGGLKAVDELSLDVETGSLVALLGPSGCGKSTLLRMIAGLDHADQGRIFINGQEATERSVQDRHVGFVFQHFALFKHRTVRENIAFGLELLRWPKPKIRHRVEELLNLVQLQGYGTRYPSQLSGGQRQRVSLARALAVKPDVLLLDEPFSALDAKVRKELRAWLRQLHEEMQVTTVIVTHDQEEAMEVADRIVVMNQGHIEQVGSPAEIYDHPASPFVMNFVGEVNVLSAPSANGGNGKLFVRPHDLELFDDPQEQSFPGVLKRLAHFGKEVHLELLLDDGQLINAQLPRERYDDRGDSLHLGARLHILPRESRSFN